MVAGAITERLASRAACVAFAFSLLGCSDTPEDEFTYGKADMEGLVVGTWTGSWLPTDAPMSTLTLVLDSQNDPSTRRASCTNRTFSATSGPELRPTCAASSSLAVSGTLSVADGSFDTTAVAGDYSIWSLNLGPGWLSVASPDGATALSADQDQDYAWVNCRIQTSAGEVVCTLDSRF